MRVRTTLLRIIAVGDVVGGALLAVFATWFGDQLDVASPVVRFVGIAAVVLGIVLLRLQPCARTARLAMVTEALFALLAVDVLVLADPTGLGVALLVATALYGAAMAVELFLVNRRTPAPLTA